MFGWLQVKKRAHWMVVGLAVCSLPAGGQQRPQPDLLGGRIAGLNAQLESLTSLVPDAPGVRQLLFERATLLRELIATDPRRAAALRLATPLASRIRAASPQSEIEQESDWTGALRVLVEDDFTANRSRRRYFLHSNDGDWEVFFAAGAAPDSSARLTVHGVGLAARIAAMEISPPTPTAGEAERSRLAEANAAEVDVAAAGPECATVGVQDTAVILVTTPSQPVFPSGFTTSYFQQEFFGTTSGSLATDSLNRVVQEMSNGQASVAGQVFGPFALAQNYACSDSNALANAAIAAADPSVNFTTYRRIVVVFPVSTCSYGGLGTIGCSTESTSEGSVNASISWIPITPSSQPHLLLGLVAHEYGHNLGLHHADTADYGSVPLGRLGVLGTVVEYGDRFSIMGLSRSFNGQLIAGQYSASHKSLALNWMTPGAYQEVQTSGTFQVVPFENSNGLRALRILRDAATSSWLWLEYRQPLGDMDSSLALLQNFSGGTNIFDGALIHYEDPLRDPLRSNLLDFTPSNTPNNFGHSTLTPGSSWSDPDSLLRISTTGATSSGATVNITYDAACATLFASATAFPPAGGSGTITVTAPSSCAWTASSAFSWLNLTGSTSGQGNGAVPFTVQANGGAPQRNGYITVQRQSIAFVQEGSGVSAISVTPRRGSGTSGQFTFVAKNGAGFQGITGVVIAFSDVGNFAPKTCMIDLTPSGTAFLLNDAGSTFLPGININTPNRSVSNSQCTLFSNGSSIAGSGNQLTIILQISFSLSFGGTHRITARVDGSASGETVPLGMWTVGSGCGYSLGSTGQSFDAAGGTGAVNVLTSAGCVWSATSNDAWITVTSGSSGNGNGNAGYAVAANSSAAARTGTMTIAGQTFTVQQAGGVVCGYSFSPLSANFSPVGGNGSVTVTAPAGCSWSAFSDVAWMTVTSGSLGNGNGPVGYSVAANAAPAARTGTLTIGGQTFPVQQSGSAPCNYALGSSGATFGVAGGTGTVAVIAPSGCSWTALSNAAWLTVTSGSSGSGNGTVGFSASNLGSSTSRTGALDIAGLPFTVLQNSAMGGSIAHIASGGTWKMMLNYLNLGTAANSFSMSFFGNNGNALPLPFTFPQGLPGVTTSTLSRTLNPGAQLVAESTGLDAAPVLQGWGRLQPSAGMQAFGIFSNPANQWEAVVPLESRDASRYTLAFDNTGTIATGVALANLASLPANIPVVIRGTAGNPLLSTQLVLPGLGHTSFMLADQYPVTANQRGVIEFQTPVAGRISVLGLRANGPSLTTLPVLTATASGGGSVTHVLFNGGFTNSFTLVNTGNTAAPATLSFYDQNGAALTVPLSLPQTGESFEAASLTRTLAAGASLLIQTLGNASLPVVVGSARLSTAGSVDAFGIFRWTASGREASVPLEQRNAGSYVLPLDNTNGLSTGLALANATDIPATVTVLLRNDAGALLQSTSIQLPARGQTSFMLPVQYPVAAGQRGTAEFVTPPGGRISVLGLRATPTGNLTTIPVLAK